MREESEINSRSGERTDSVNKEVCESDLSHKKRAMLSLAVVDSA